MDSSAGNPDAGQSSAQPPGSGHLIPGSVLGRRCRALSVRRPWANLIISGAKPLENRSWSVGYRGLLVLHGGTRWEPTDAELAATLGLDDLVKPAACPAGYLGTVRLVDIHPSASCCAPWGLPGPHIFHWVLAEPRRFTRPVPALGKRGLFWTDALNE